MNTQLDKRITSAVNSLWIDPWNNDGTKAKSMLEEAANEGNGDACFFLGRCYLGECFINPKFGFEEDEKKGMEYFNKSIELGSAIGMFGSQRLSGFKPRCGSFIHEPYSSLKEIWDEVNTLAQNGDVFCQYMIGNAYYYGDCIEMLGYNKNQVDIKMIQSFQRQAIELFEKSIEKGLTLAIPNLIDILSSGDYGIAKDQKRVEALIKRGAELNHPFYECKLAQSLKETDIQQALQLFESSITHGSNDAYYYIGQLYTFEGELPRDLQKAKQYFEEGIKHSAKETGCKNELGRIYFYGGDGIEKDYDKAFKLFKETKQENNWCSDMLGTCYLKGLGTTIDYIAAKKEFEIYSAEELSAIGLGEIYCYGLGVKQNINTGMNYLNQFPDNPRVNEIKSHFKHTLFGWRQIK